MKNSKAKKILVPVMALSVCLNTAAIPLSASCALPDNDGSIISPLYIAITKVTNTLKINTTGVFNCTGVTNVSSGYTAEVIVELQRDTGSWTTVQKWTAKSVLSASVYQTKSVSKGYTYRLKTTHKAYNSNGTLIETVTEYSDEITYN